MPLEFKKRTIISEFESPFENFRTVKVTGEVRVCPLSGHPTRRLPGAASFLVEFIEGESMLMLMNQKGIAASSGSACTSRALKASHVLTAMGIPPEQAHGSLLFSFGIQNNEEDVDHVVESLPPIVETLRKMSPLYDKFMKGQRGG